MELSLTRNEKLFLILSAAVILLFLTAFSKLSSKSSSESQFDTSELIDYQMIRPEQAYAGYSLAGREVNHHFEGIKAKLGKILAAALGAKKEVKKAEDLKKASAKVAAASDKSKTNENKVSTEKVAYLSAQSLTVVKTKDAPEQTENLKNKDNKESPNTSNQTQSLGENRNSEQPEPVDPNLNSKNKKTFAQWRAEIFANPTKESITAFINAYRKGELTTAEFQALAQDLLDQEDAQIKGLGLMALRAQPSLESLSQLVFIQEQMPSALQAYIEQAYLVYLQPQNLGIFNQAFQTKNKKLIVKSLGILNVNIQKLKSGDVSAMIDSRQRKETDLAPSTMSNFKTLLPSLLLISSVQDPEINSLANQVTGLIQNAGSIAGI